MRLPVLATLGLAALAGSLLRAAQAPAPLPAPTAVYQTQCFALDRLEPADRTLAAEWLEAALDREGLYTLIGGLKPISTGVHSLKFDTAQPDLTGLDQARRIAAALSCGGVSAFVHIFAAASGTERFADLVLVNQPALDHTLREHRAFFAPLGLTPGTPGLQVMAMIDHLPREPRYRGLGHLFGFPDHAVDFFVAATVPDKPVVGPGKDRDFFSVPVFRDGTNYFVWAVPLGHTPLPADTAIVEKAAPILKSYRERRAHFIGPGKSGAPELLRDWLCDNTGMCAADRALQRLSTTLRSPDSPLSRASQLLRDRKPAKAARLLKELASQPMDDESARRRRLLSEDAAVRTGDAAWLARLSDRPDRYWFANGYLVFTAYGYMRASDLPAAREYLSRLKDTDRMDDRERRRYHSLMARIAQLEQKPGEEQTHLEWMIGHQAEWSTPRCQQCHDNRERYGDVVTSFPLTDWWVAERYAAVLRETGRADDIGRLARQSLTASPDNVEARLRLAFAQRALGQNADSEQTLRALPWAAFPDRPYRTPRDLIQFP